MSKKERPIHILWIDDKHKEYEDTKALLQNNRIIVKSAFINSQEGMAELGANFHKYDAVILDAKALRAATSAVGTETEKSLRDSINSIRKISADNGRAIPYCVYTGYYNDIGNAWEDEIRFFSKAADIDEMIQFIKEEVALLPETQIIDQYSNVFEIFDSDAIDVRYKGMLLDICKTMDTNSLSQIEGMLNKGRKILEGYYKCLNDLGRLHPDLFHADGRPNLTWCLRYLEGKGIDGFNHEIPPAFIPQHVASALHLINANTSAYGAHDNSEIPTNYTLKTTVFAILDILSWLNEKINENK
ncbi:MAG: hypothetical protein IPL46_13420 [Saprospiraceae bacterium]|nr:hypothetical protein [Saprospiraceae bacterium]